MINIQEKVYHSLDPLPANLAWGGWQQLMSLGWQFKPGLALLWGHCFTYCEGTLWYFGSLFLSRLATLSRYLHIIISAQSGKHIVYITSGACCVIPLLALMCVIRWSALSPALSFLSISAWVLKSGWEEREGWPQIEVFSVQHHRILHFSISLSTFDSTAGEGSLLIIAEIMDREGAGGKSGLYAVLFSFGFKLLGHKLECTMAKGEALSGQQHFE